MGEIAEALRIEMVKRAIEANVVNPNPSNYQMKADPPSDTKPSPKTKTPIQETKTTTQKKEKDVKVEPKKEVKKTPKKENKNKEELPREEPDKSKEIFNVNGVHLEVYKFFNTSPSLVDQREIDQLRKINRWAFDKQDNVGKALKKIRDEENKIGRSSGRDRLIHIYNQIRIKELS